MCSSVNKTMVPLNWKLRLLPDHFDLPVPLQWKALVLMRLVDPEHQGEGHLLLWHWGDVLG